MTEWAVVELDRRPYVIVVMGSFGLGEEFKEAIRETSKAAYEFFHRLSTATKYGAYVDPAEWKKK
jgi:beta-lactamase class A